MRWLSMFLLGVSWFKILHSSLTHFEFIFEYGATKCSSFILLHEKKFSQKHLWKRLSFLHCIFLSPLSQINATYESRFISGLYSVPWIWVAVLGPVPYYWLFGAFYGSIVFFFFWYMLSKLLHMYLKQCNGKSSVYWERSQNTAC